MKKKFILFLLIIIGSIFSIYAQELLEIINYGFEHYIEFYGWEKIGTAKQILRDSKIRRSGFYSCRFQDPTSDYSGRGIISSSSSVKENEVYRIGGYFYVSKESDTAKVDATKIKIQLIWYLTQGTTQEVTYEDLTVKDFNSWELVSVISTAPAGSQAVRVGFYVKETINYNNDVYLDDVLAKIKIERLDISEVVKVVGLNPFSPADGETTYIQIFLKGHSKDEASWYYAVVKIFDISGKEVALLKSENMKDNPEIIEWSGSYYNRLKVAPVGVYIVYAELYNSANGKKYVGKDVVVVGRKWK